MQVNAANVDNYFTEVPEDHRDVFKKLRETIKDNIPAGFSEEMSYGMIGYVVPHALYPAGYHCNPSLPLPFAGIAARKNFISFYHMGIYADSGLMEWFTNEYISLTGKKPNLGKSCIRFKKPWNIPYTLLSELVGKITVEEWIKYYEQNYKKK